MAASSAEAPIDLTLDSDDELGLSDAAIALSNPRPPTNSHHVPTPSTAVPAYPPRTIPSPRHIAGQPSSLAYDEPPLSSAQPSNTSGGHVVSGWVPVFSNTMPAEESDDFEMPYIIKRRRVTNPPPGVFFKPIPPRIKKPTGKFYGVKVGHVPGVYTDWETTRQQITGCKGAIQQRFKTRELAQAFVEGRLNPRPEPERLAMLGLATGPSIDSSTDSRLEAGGTGYNQANRPPSVQSPDPLNPEAVSDSSAGNEGASRFLPQVPSVGPEHGLFTPEVSDSDPNGRAIRPSSAGTVSADQPQGGLSNPLTYDASRDNDPRSPGAHPPNEMSSALDTVLNTFVEDKVYLELLSRAPANDMIALLLSDTPRGKQLLHNASAPINPNAPATSSLASSGRDSVFSDSEISNAKVPMAKMRSGVASLSHDSETTRPKWTGGLSLEEAHLLIYLKEVCKYKWTEITAKFQRHFPARSYGILQTNYSQKINRRDRSQDPSTLILPSCYAHDAQTRDPDVHASPGHPAGIPRHPKRVTEEKQERFQKRSKNVVASSRTTVIDLLHDQSSGAESSNRARRSRRTVPIKNYTWPTKDTQLLEDSFGGNDTDMEEPNRGSPSQSESPVELNPAPETAIAVDNEPLSVEFNQEDASLAIMTTSQKPNAGVQPVPYLSYCQRSSLTSASRGFEWDQLVSRDWQGILLHVDFSSAELDIAEAVIMRSLRHEEMSRSRNQAKRLHHLLKRVTEPELLSIKDALRSKLHSRDRASIDSFLQDAKGNKIRGTAPRVERLGAARPDKTSSSEVKLSLASMIRRRETGVQTYRGWSSATKPLSYQMKNMVQDSLGPVCSYTGASSDIHAVAWSVDGQCFAAGAICVDDPHSMQYNRSNNLLYGDVSRNTINELGKHHVPRPRTESGPNSTHAMYASQDSKLYKTVTAVAFSPNGRFMFSGGYDHNVTVWQTRYDGSQPSEIVSLRYRAEVLMMDVNNSGVLATATKKSTGKAVKVLQLNEDDPLSAPATVRLGSEKATQRPEMNIQPTALHFSPRHGNLLLGGFGAQTRQDGRDQMGDICLWDINHNHTLNIWGSSKNVFDLSFHPRNPWFAVGAVAGLNTNRGTRSTIRVYDEHDTGSHSKYSTSVELECRALDINDVVWCPGDDFLVAAGCTSGRAYVWDIRNPTHFLRELTHGNSLMPLDEFTDREVADTGVRFLTWGENATRLYTGSSDGIVKIWNVARSEEETFVKDLVTLNSGIMSGAFSPDRNRLLLGEVNGTINVLEVGRDDCSLQGVERMKYFPYKDYEDRAENTQSVSVDASSGRGIAKELVDTGQMMIVPAGGLPTRQAVQGPAYSGPYDVSVEAPFLREQALEMQLKFAATRESSCEACSIQDLKNNSGNGVKITSESTGDSGRSLDRIPDAMRLQREAGPAGSKGSNDVTNEGLCKVPCSQCGLPARPSEEANDSGSPNISPRCERCAFSCLRCGYTPETEELPDALGERCLDSEIKTYTCPHCSLVWEVGALGYELIHDSHKPCQIQNNIPPLTRFGKEMFLAKVDVQEPTGNNNVSFGDEMNALTDYYLSLALDQSELPL